MIGGWSFQVHKAHIGREPEVTAAIEVEHSGCGKRTQGLEPGVTATIGVGVFDSQEPIKSRDPEVTATIGVCNFGTRNSDCQSRIAPETTGFRPALSECCNQTLGDGRFDAEIDAGQRGQVAAQLRFNLAPYSTGIQKEQSCVRLGISMKPASSDTAIDTQPAVVSPNIRPPAALQNHKISYIRTANDSHESKIKPGYEIPEMPEQTPDPGN
ncbi:hypothetical protein B0H11DRAFT_1906093 [Mycena galericulata]|nr:hypothetical protein B0H11DRAFT_1906093 [Mycena galericulata]